MKGDKNMLTWNIMAINVVPLTVRWNCNIQLWWAIEATIPICKHSIRCGACASCTYFITLFYTHTATFSVSLGCISPSLFNIVHVFNGPICWFDGNSCLINLPKLWQHNQKIIQTFSARKHLMIEHWDFKRLALNAESGMLSWKYHFCRQHDVLYKVSLNESFEVIQFS